MKTLLYCYRSSIFNNWLGLVQVRIFPRVLTCPPTTAVNFPVRKLAAVDLFYLVLHGYKGDRTNLYGDPRSKNDTRRSNRYFGLTTEALLALQMKPGSIVFMEGCWGLETSFPDFFLQHGASAVIASDKFTKDDTRRLGDAGKFGQAFVHAMKNGFSVRWAMSYARDKHKDTMAAKSFYVKGEGDTWLAKGGKE